MSQASSRAVSVTTKMDSKKPKRRKTSKSKPQRYELFLRHGNKYKEMLAFEMATLEMNAALYNQANSSPVMSMQPTTAIFGTFQALSNDVRQHCPHLQVQTPYLASTAPSATQDIYSQQNIPPFQSQQHFGGGGLVISKAASDETGVFSAFPTHPLASGHKLQQQIGSISSSSLTALNSFQSFPEGNWYQQRLY